MQITLTPAGIAAANYANSNGLTITISKFRVYRSNVAEVSLPYATTGLEDLATLAAWTWLPNGVEFNTVEEFEPLDADTVQFVCVLDETVGDFDYDILTLWLDDGTFFGLAANRVLWRKFQAGNPPANQHKIHVSFTFTNAAATTNINIDNAKWTFDFIPEVNSVDDLPEAELSVHRIYRCTRQIGVGTVADRGVRSYLVQSGKAVFDPQLYQHNEWIPSDHRLVFEENVVPWVQSHASNTSFQNTTTRVVLQFDVQDTFEAAQIAAVVEKSLILSFFNPGTNEGLLRQVDSYSVLTDGSGIWVAFVVAALPGIQSLGSTVKVYTSQMDRQVPVPTAAGQVLVAKAKSLGLGYEWATPEDPSTFMDASKYQNLLAEFSGRVVPDNLNPNLLASYVFTQAYRSVLIRMVAAGGGGGAGGIMYNNYEDGSGGGGGGGSSGAAVALLLLDVRVGDTILLALGDRVGTNSTGAGIDGHPSLLRIERIGLSQGIECLIPGGKGGAQGYAGGNNNITPGAGGLGGDLPKWRMYMGSNYALPFMGIVELAAIASDPGSSGNTGAVGPGNGGSGGYGGANSFNTLAAVGGQGGSSGAYKDGGNGQAGGGGGGGLGQSGLNSGFGPIRGFGGQSGYAYAQILSIS